MPVTERLGGTRRHLPPFLDGTEGKRLIDEPREKIRRTHPFIRKLKGLHQEEWGNWGYERSEQGLMPPGELIYLRPDTVAILEPDQIQPQTLAKWAVRAATIAAVVKGSIDMASHLPSPPLAPVAITQEVPPIPPILIPPANPASEAEQPRVIDPDSAEARISYTLADEATELPIEIQTFLILFNELRKFQLPPDRYLYAAWQASGFNPSAIAETVRMVGNRTKASEKGRGVYLLTPDVFARGVRLYLEHADLPEGCIGFSTDQCAGFFRIDDPGDNGTAFFSLIVWGGPDDKQYADASLDSESSYQQEFKLLKEEGNRKVSFELASGETIIFKVLPLIPSAANIEPPRFLSASEQAKADVKPVAPQPIKVSLDATKLPDFFLATHSANVEVIPRGGQVIQIGDYTFDFSKISPFDAIRQIIDSEKSPKNFPKTNDRNLQYQIGQLVNPKIEAIFKAIENGDQAKVERFMKVFLCESRFYPGAQNGIYMGLAQFDAPTWIEFTGLDPAYREDWRIHTLATAGLYFQNTGRWPNC